MQNVWTVGLNFSSIKDCIEVLYICFTAGREDGMIEGGGVSWIICVMISRYAFLLLSFGA